MNVKSIAASLKKHESRLRDEFKVHQLFLFGSAVRGEFKRGSDIDLLVEFSAPIGLFAFVALKEFLEQILRQPVDLVTRDSIRPWMISDIERESVRVA